MLEIISSQLLGSRRFRKHTLTRECVTRVIHSRFRGHILSWQPLSVLMLALSSHLPEVNVHASGVNDFSAYGPTNPLKVETKHGVNGVTVCHLSHTYFLNPVTFFFQRKPKLCKGLSDDVQDRIRMYGAWLTFVFDCVHIHKISCGDAMPCGFAKSFPSAISRVSRAACVAVL